MKDKKENRTKRPLWRRVVKVLLWVSGSVVALVVLLFGVLLIMLSPSRLTPLVNDLASGYLNAEVHFDEIDVSLWRDFPRVSVGIDRARIISHAIDSSNRDTLAVFERLYVSLDAMKIIDGDIDVQSIRLVGADLSARIDSTGHASWEIYTASADTTTEHGGSIAINVDRLIIEGRGRARFVDERNSTNIEASFDKISALRVGDTKYTFQLDLGLEKAVFDSVDYSRYTPLTLRGGVEIDYKALSVDSLMLAIGVNDISLGIAGSARMVDTLIYSDLKVDCSDLPVERIVSFLPLAPGDELRKLHSDLQFSFALNVNGSYNLNDHRLPRITANLKSNQGGVRIEGRYLSIEKFAIDASVGFEPSVPENNFVDLRRLDVKGNVGNFSASAKVTNMLGDYHINGHLNGHISLAALNHWMPSKIRLGGAINCDVNANFSRHQLKINKIGRANLSAKIVFDSARYADDSSKVMLAGLITASAAKDVFILKTQIDTISFDDRRLEMSGAGRDLRFATGIKAEQRTMRDSTAVYPFGGSLRAQRLNMTGADSSRIRMRDVAIRFSVIPHKRDNTIPCMQASVDARSLSVAQGPSRIAMGKTAIKVSAELIRSDRELALAREHRLDSLQAIYPDVRRDKLIAHNRALHPRRARAGVDQSDVDLNPGKTVRDLLRRWRANGVLTSKSVRVSTPYMPLRTRFTDFNIEFNTDSILLHSLKGRIGRSEVSITGEVTGMRRAFQSRGALIVDIDLQSDTLDINQLIIAGNAGIAMLGQFDGVNLDDHSDDQVEAMITAAIDTTAPSVLVMIPKNVVLDARLKVNHAIYANFIFDSLTTELISRNKVLQIKELSAGSEIGKLSLHALYATPSKDDITTSADIELLGVDVGRLIDQMPQIDTMLPMLASFEGMVDLRASARTRIDSSMNVIIPSLNAVATLKGQNLVLLDGQTFAEISKMLSFKNKQRNIVDSISVEMKVVDERVEFFPFIFSLDRYKAAVSGQHGMDMKFDYHISVLKSIIPFRVGVDIKGNIDDWDFKITQAKYKTEQLPSYTYQIDSMRINLREEIIGVFDKLNKEATNVQNR